MAAGRLPWLANGFVVGKEHKRHVGVTETAAQGQERAGIGTFCHMAVPKGKLLGRKELRQKRTPQMTNVPRCFAGPGRELSFLS